MSVRPEDHLEIMIHVHKEEQLAKIYCSLNMGELRKVGKCIKYQAKLSSSVPAPKGRGPFVEPLD